jgi:hypothetical protein
MTIVTCCVLFKILSVDILSFAVWEFESFEVLHVLSFWTANNK